MISMALWQGSEYFSAEREDSNVAQVRGKQDRTEGKTLSTATRTPTREGNVHKSQAIIFWVVTIMPDSHSVLCA